MRTIREDGVIAWAAYTDHDPMEMMFSCGRRWWPEQKVQQDKVPNFRSILGPTEEAEREAKEVPGKQ